MSIMFLIAAAAVAASPISADRIRNDDRTLSSDTFAGRGPGEDGEAATIAFLAKEFAAAGLEPGGERGGWFQDVPLVRLDRLPGARLSVTTGGSSFPLALARDATLALRNVGRTSILDAPLVFAGYGIVDARLGWNAYRDIDMTGKVAVVLANDPDFEGGSDLGFEGRRLVFSGRIGAKFAAAAKAGAIGALVIHEDAAASYPFSQVASGDALPAMFAAPLAPSRFQASGWISGAAADALLRRTGLDLAKVKRMARNASFRAFAMAGATVSIDAQTVARPVISHNVIAKLSGTTRANDYVLYGAHWDANGTNGPDASGDAIRNGAIDNAAGTAELLEVARAFASGARPDRTVVFVAWTAEEKGLLGSAYYADHPLFPLARTAAVFNLDPHFVLPAARTIELIGGGRTPLEQDLARHSTKFGLRVVPEPSPEAGWYFRSDHYSFAQKGVPTVAFRIGRDLVDGGYAKGATIVSRFNMQCYHQPCDQFDTGWSFAGAAQEATVAHSMGLEIANSAAWPEWQPTSDYAALRQASSSERNLMKPVSP